MRPVDRRAAVRVLRPSFLFALLAFGLAILQPASAANGQAAPPADAPFVPRAEQLYRPVFRSTSIVMAPASPATSSKPRDR